MITTEGYRVYTSWPSIVGMYNSTSLCSSVIGSTQWVDREIPSPLGWLKLGHQPPIAEVMSILWLTKPSKFTICPTHAKKRNSRAGRLCSRYRHMVTYRFP